MNMVFVKGHQPSRETRKKISDANKGIVPWNKGKRNHLSPETLEKMSESGKGKVPWNKGQRGKVLSEETRKRMAKAHIGKILSKETKRKISKRIKGNTPWKGKRHSEETKRKLSKLKSGKNHPFFGKRGKGTPNWGKGHSEESKKRMSESSSGVNHPRWKGGIKMCPYSFGFNENLREKIRNQFNGECVISLQKEARKKLSVHHINGDKNDHRPENLIPLQGWAHSMIHADEEFWNGTPYLNIKRG